MPLTADQGKPPSEITAFPRARYLSTRALAGLLLSVLIAATGCGSVQTAALPAAIPAALPADLPAAAPAALPPVAPAAPTSSVSPTPTRAPSNSPDEAATSRTPAKPASPSSSAAARGAACSPPATCFTADRSTPLTISKPGVYDGQGHRVPSIRITSGGVTVRRFVVSGGKGTGIWSEGQGNVIADNDISRIAYGGDDLDAMRFFGTGTKILRNKVHNLVVGNPKDAHVDCMQTYASSRPASRNVEIAGNDCRGRDLHQCVMAEGPGSTDGGGGASGRSAGWTIRNNHFECHANQAISFRDIDDSVIEGNTFAGSGRKAIQLTDGSTGVKVGRNTLGRGYGSLVGD